MRSALGIGTAAWVVLASAVGWVAFELGPCPWREDPWPRSRGAELVCRSGTFPYEPLFLTFVVTAFVGLALVLLAPPAGPRRTWSLVGAAALPLAAYAALRVIVAFG